MSNKYRFDYIFQKQPFFRYIINTTRLSTKYIFYKKKKHTSCASRSSIDLKFDKIYR
jgi:hypothetical protein